jgi:ABC-type transporter Mla subunit MlaD
VKKSLGTAAKSFAGNGDAFNLAIQQTGDLVNSTAGQTDDLLQVAQNLNTLAGVVKGREQVLGTLIQDFGTASKVFADEKGDIQDLVKGLLTLLNNGGDLLNKYQGNLPGDLAVLTRVALVLQGDVKSVGGLITALPKVSSAFINGYDPSQKALVLRFALDAFLRTWIRALTKNDNTPCNCPWMTKGGK